MILVLVVQGGLLRSSAQPRRAVVTLSVADTQGMHLGGFWRISRCHPSGLTSRSRYSCSWFCSPDSHFGPQGAANAKSPSCKCGGPGGGGLDHRLSGWVSRTRRLRVSWSFNCLLPSPFHGGNRASGVFVGSNPTLSAELARERNPRSRVHACTRGYSPLRPPA